ncbi:glycosyltransferase family 4 protein [Microbacterium sp. SD291]|uniref:glycosyltransferase family 4 protein n=1 Tax=Microbacterium sp. SD291 TaxID=2782007 RepID=UPI001A972B70|nr:glycosyltransferase family 4 protein [Microbacterium sp. SD291]MBO0980985.1 glycosyltransferase [Microbacterium sp. SD291]
MALARLLSVEPGWHADVMLPADDGEDAFVDLPSSARRWVCGVRQNAGGSSASPLRMIDVGIRLLVQAAVTRWHPTVRNSDLIVANSTRAAAYAALALRGTDKPFVVHLRDHVSADSLGTFGHRLMTQLILPRADGVIANSNGTLETAAPYIRRNAVSAVIPSPAGLGEVHDPKRSGDALRVGMLARIDPWKGQMLLLEAFALAFPKGAEQLDIAGGSPFMHDDFLAQLKRRAGELGVADRVNFLGHVDDIAPLLAGWDIAVQSSLRPEPLGQNVLQYLASGTATIVADEGGPTEWVQHDVNGLRVRPRDVDALSSAMRALAADPARRRRLAARAASTQGLMDDREIAENHARAYGDVLRRAGVKVRIRSSRSRHIVAAA